MFNPFKTSTKFFPIDSTSHDTIVDSIRNCDRYFGAKRTTVKLSADKKNFVVTKKSIFSH